jgi:nuclear GTP-binding protein
VLCWLKSSLINSLKRCRAVAVGNRPGVTRHVQQVRLDKLLTLIDSPGVIAAASADSQQAADERLLLRNCISVDKLSDPVAAAEVLLRHVPLDCLLTTYSLPASATASSFLVHLARKQGKLLPGGLPNVDVAARCLLQDLNSGKISYETEPPEDGDEVAAGAVNAAQVVQGWAAEFDVEALLAGNGDIRVERSDEQDENNDLEGMESMQAQEPIMAENAGVHMEQA